MIDIVGADSGGMRLLDTDVEKAKNILATQLGSLEYLPDLGVDLEFFLDPDFEYQNESFKAYLVEVLARQSINVTQVVEVVEALYSRMIFSVQSRQTDTSLVR